MDACYTLTERTRNPLTECVIGRHPSGGPVPLTTTQLHWWNYINDHQAGLSERLVQLAIRVEGALEPERLRRIVAEISQRHEPLRTRFAVVDGVPIQQIGEDPQYEWEMVDLSALPREDADAQAKRLGEEFVRSRVPIAGGPLLATRLFRLSDREHVFVLALEHLISDIASSCILSREIWAVYQGSWLPSPPVQFADYAIWQQRTHGAWLSAHAEYWRTRLKDAPRIRLPVHDGTADVHGHLVQEHAFGRDLTGRLRELARREHTKLPLVVLALYVATLARWCNQDDLVLTFVSNARYRPELRNMVGFLASNLHLRVQIDREDRFVDLLRRLVRELDAAMEHRDLDRVPDVVPECSQTEVCFNWIPGWMLLPPEQRISVPESLTLRPFPLNAPWPRRFLPNFYDTPEGVVVALTWQPGAFTPGAIRRFGDSLTGLADEASQHPSCRAISG